MVYENIHAFKRKVKFTSERTETFNIDGQKADLKASRVRDD